MNLWHKFSRKLNRFVAVPIVLLLIVAACQPAEYQRSYMDLMEQWEAVAATPIPPSSNAEEPPADAALSVGHQVRVALWPRGSEEAATGWCVSVQPEQDGRPAKHPMVYTTQLFWTGSGAAVSGPTYSWPRAGGYGGTQCSDTLLPESLQSLSNLRVMSAVLVDTPAGHFVTRSVSFTIRPGRDEMSADDFRASDRTIPAEAFASMPTPLSEPASGDEVVASVDDATSLTPLMLWTDQSTGQEGAKIVITGEGAGNDEVRLFVMPADAAIEGMAAGLEIDPVLMDDGHFTAEFRVGFGMEPGDYVFVAMDGRGRITTTSLTVLATADDAFPATDAVAEDWLPDGFGTEVTTLPDEFPEYRRTAFRGFGASDEWDTWLYQIFWNEELADGRGEVAQRIAEWYMIQLAAQGVTDVTAESAGEDAVLLSFGAAADGSFSQGRLIIGPPHQPHAAPEIGDYAAGLRIELDRRIPLAEATPDPEPAAEVLTEEAASTEPEAEVAVADSEPEVATTEPESEAVASTEPDAEATAEDVATAEVTEEEALVEEVASSEREPEAPAEEVAAAPDPEPETSPAQAINLDALGLTRPLLDAQGVRQILPRSYTYARVLNPTAVVNAPGGGEVVRTLPSMSTWVSVREVVTVEDQTWYRIGSDEFVSAAEVAPFAPSGFQGVEVNGELPGKVGFVHADVLNVRSRPGVADDNPSVSQLRRYDAVLVQAEASAHDGVWYQIGPDRWVFGGLVRLVRPATRPDGVGPDERWIDINLSEQTVAAYEGDRMVYATMASTGLARTPTITGLFRVWAKLETGRMSLGSLERGDFYDLPDVPYIMYFQGNYGLHGAYWHDRFGAPTSRGCVNLSPSDARWLFEWASPGIPPGHTAVLTERVPEDGTWVNVRYN